MCKQDKFLFDDGLRTLASLVVNKQQTGAMVVAISGGSCSGKSYLCDCLGKQLANQGIKFTTLNLDDYFRNIDDPLLPRGDFGEPLFDAPGSYEHEEIHSHLKALIDGRPIEGPVYDIYWNQKVPGKTTRKDPTEVILVDGLFAIDMVQNLDANKLRIFVEASAATRLQRRISRETRKYRVKPETSELVFRNTVEPAHKKYVVTQRSLADLVISGER